MQLDLDDRTIAKADDDPSVYPRDVHREGITEDIPALDPRAEDGKADSSDSVQGSNNTRGLLRGRKALTPEEKAAKKARIESALERGRIPKELPPTKVKPPRKVTVNTPAQIARYERDAVNRKEANAVISAKIQDDNTPGHAIETLKDVSVEGSGAVDEVDAYIKKLLKPRIKKLITKAYELAEGVLVEKGSGSTKRVYKTPPSEKMINYLLDQYLGRSKARKDNVGSETNEMRVTVNHL